MIIHVDEHGNRYVVLVDGAKVPLKNPSIHLTLQTPYMLAGGGVEIVSTFDALALHETAAAHWFERCQQLAEENANLKEQLQRLAPREPPA